MKSIRLASGGANSGDRTASTDTDGRKAQVRAIFGRLAPEYDTAGPGCLAYFGRRLVEPTGIASGQRVLDVACGRGAVLFPAAELVMPAGEVVGIDLSGEMVRATNAEANRRRMTAPARIMDAEHLEFADGAFSRVLCGFGLMFFPHLDQALHEFDRVLDPGGRIGVSTWQVSQADDVRAVLDELGLGGPGEQGWITEPNALVDGAAMAAALAWRGVDQLLLKHAGFSDVTVHLESHAFHYADLDEYLRTARGTGERHRLERLDADETDRVRSRLAARLARYEQSDGLHVPAAALLAIAGASRDDRWS
jgi:O-methyltransferase / aklanonic acid methyltransferase